MKENNEFFYHDQSKDLLIMKYEEMIHKNAHYFFDVHEFEDIIDYYFDQNEFSSAIRAIELAINQHPTASSIQMKKAQVLIDEGKPFQALKIINQIESLEADNEEIFIMKAFAHNSLGNVKEAIRQFELAIKWADENEKGELLHNIGLSFQGMMHHKLAVKYLLKAYEYDPGNFQLLYDLAHSYERNNEFRKSLDFYHKFLDEDPYAELVWYKLGGVHEKINEYEKAIEAYDYCLAIDDSYSLAYYSKANALAELKNYKEAVNVYLEFLRLEEDYLEVYCNIGLCYEYLGRDREAIHYYKAALAIEEDYAEAWYYLAVLETKNDNYEQAIYYIDKALFYEPNNIDYWLLSGEISLFASKNDRAERCFRHIVDLDPYIISYWTDYADFLIKTYNDPVRTLAVLKEADSQMEAVADILYRMAVMYYLIGEKEKCYDTFEKALQDNNDFLLIDEVLVDYVYLRDDPRIIELLNQYTEL